MTAREAAYHWIRRIEDSAYSNLLIGGISTLSAEDQAFAAKIALTCTERRLTLEHILRAYSKKPIEKLDKPVRTVLVMGLCQILYMNVPDNAAVNESVKLIKKLRFVSAGAMVNGILRSFIRDGKVIPPVKGDDCDKLSVEYSVPDDLIRRVSGAYGMDNALIWLRRLDSVPDTYIRTNTRRTSTAELMEKLAAEELEPSEGPVEGSIKLGRTDFDKPSFAQGLYYVQGLSSQMCADAVQASDRDVILDICAAPGGKSFTMAQSGARVISCELYERRAGLIRREAARLGFDDIEVIVNDGTVYSEKLASYHPTKVLCDVPCSGYGVSGKPEIRYKPHDAVKDLPELQYSILCTSAGYLTAGGTIVYSTCTVEPAENGGVTDRFVKGQGFEKEFEKTIFREDSDGFYICRMVKR
ncbi:MAG: hypothetical protein J6I96_02345 [Oscillospiraceae bacterium]|nr:hypothetical protein [Oscillospiraceae bacterium]